ncbi:MAG TPA: alpha/beta fold hydrolase [Kofleriaceae bacterium]|nr:alpha/beta fold hydrolase [Kofleriaceae bacterium]
MSNLSERARWALDSALSRAGSAVDQGVLRFMRAAMSGRQRASRAGTHGFASQAARSGDPRARLLEIADHYRAAEADLFAPPPAPEVIERALPARAGAARVVDLAYPSRFRPTWPAYREEFASYDANLTARVRLYSGGAEPRPVVICLHGWGAGRAWLDERAFVVPYLLRIGLDVALFQLPFHGQRTPAGSPRSGALFPGPNVVRTNESFGQAISDLRALALHLRERGAPAVGALGMSLGGYTSALWAGLDRDLGFAAVIIPAVSMSRLFWAHGEGSPARRRAERAGVTADLLDDAFAVHCPLGRPVLLERDRLLIAAARGDRITPPEQAEMLWRHWGEPELCWVAGGHLTQLARGDAFRAFRRVLRGAGLAS